MSTHGPDGVVQRGDHVLTLPDAAEALRTVAVLARSPVEDEHLRTAVGDGNLVNQLLREAVLVPDLLTPDLVALHAATTSGPPSPVASPPVADLPREVRDYGEPSVSLAPPKKLRGSLAEALTSRRSARAFTGGTVPADDLSTLLANAIRPADVPFLPTVSGAPPGSRPYPSAGALFPVEVALLTARIGGLAPGTYRYAPGGHKLIPHGGEVSATRLRWLLNDHPVDGLAVVITFTCDLSAPALAKYGAKAYRMILLEAGHLAQNLLLAAASLGIAALPLCGFRDDDLAAELGLCGPHEVVLYAVVLGTSGDGQP
ncbi:SagB/ThcOx family dehydrogenase [Actinopolymorpha singaporensis]|uniref:SagB/ThcOx family dehydrogenase n=1 Tax=Actinopolymorpha singaporensis TaxID=117157 RepID=UPI0012FD39F3|nr:SagB/ThcOx family dehydrogenase [Actinopolymorpha singaporensis]